MHKSQQKGESLKFKPNYKEFEEVQSLIKSFTLKCLIKHKWTTNETLMKDEIQNLGKQI